MSRLILDPFNNPDEDVCIHVRSRFEVDRLFKRRREGRYHAMVSIGDPGTEPWFVEEAAERGLKVLRLEFEDVESRRDGVAPDREDMRIINEFLEEVLPELRGQCLLIHCEQGISRSAAVAVLAWEKLGLTFDEAFKQVVAGRPIAMPNMLMIELAR